MTQENLRAGLVAAASIYPEAYRSIKRAVAVTSTQELQLVLDRAQDIAAWLDAAEGGRVLTAVEVLRERAPAPAEIEPSAAAAIFADPDALSTYAKWLDQTKQRDNAKTRRRYLQQL